MPFKQLLFLNYCNTSLRCVISNELSPIERAMLLKEDILRGVLILGLQMCAQDISSASTVSESFLIQLSDVPSVLSIHHGYPTAL